MVPVSALWSDESGVVAILLVNGNAVVSIPGIEDGLFGVGGHQSGLMKGRLCVICVLRGWISIVLRDFPFFFAHITFRWHHMTGSPIGTCLMTPRRTSLSRPALTSSFQWIGTCIGVWCAMGSALDGS